MLLHRIYPVVQEVNILCLNSTRTTSKKDWHPDYTVFIVRVSNFVKNKNIQLIIKTKEKGEFYGAKH